MLLHDNYIFCLVKFKAVVEFHCIVKCTNSILYLESIFDMAESDKTLMKDENFSNINRKSSAPSIVPPPSGTMQNDIGAKPNTIASEPSTLKRKQTSFQITSVTVKGARLSTDGGEDSADDLDESHTEDASSDILDCSRTTDVDNDQLSEDNSNTTNNDDVLIPAPSIPAESKIHLPIKKLAQNNALIFPSEASQNDKSDVPADTNQHVKPPTLPDQWQHRFRVVKIVSSVPFKRGRWLCMDFMDPPAPIVEAKPESNDSGLGIGPGMLPGESIPADRVAHVYEIPPGDAYPGTLSMVIRPDERLQPMYGIFFPINNNGQHPLVSGMNSKAIATPVHSEVKSHEPSLSLATTQNLQHQQNIPPTQTTISSQAVHHKIATSTQSTISSQGVQQNVSNTQTSVSNQGFQQSQILQNTQPIVSTTGIKHQQNMNVIQPVTSNPGIIHNVSCSQSHISSHGVPQTVTTIQSTIPSLGNQNISQTQPTISTQGGQSTATNIQSLSQGIQQNIINTQSLASVQGIQQNIPVTQSSNSMQGISQNLPITQPAISNQGVQPPLSIPSIQNVSSQTIPHQQNVTSLHPTTQGTNLPSNVQPIPKQVSAISSDQLPCQTNLVSNVQTQVQNKASQHVLFGQSNSPPQSQTSVKIASSVAGQPLTGTSDPSISQSKPVSSLLGQSQQASESQSKQPQKQLLSSSQSQAVTVSPTMHTNIETVVQTNIASSCVPVSDSTLKVINQESVVQSQVQQSSVASILNVGAQASGNINASDVLLVSNSKPQDTIPSQIIQNHVEAKEHGTPPSTNVHVMQDVSQEIPPVKNDVNGEDSESVPSGTNTVAIDNKIEQAMDLVKSHLMFAVREEVDVLKEKITELMDRISQLEYENGFLRANASQQTLEQLNHSQLLQQQQQQQQQNQSSTASMNSTPQIPQQSLQSHQINIQDQQPMS